jgi:hypothetical protein
MIQIREGTYYSRRSHPLLWNRNGAEPGLKEKNILWWKGLINELELSISFYMSKLNR